MWMYGRSIQLKDESEDGDLLIRAWAVADRLMINECKNLIMDRIQAHFAKHLVRNSTFGQVESLGLSATQAMTRFLKDQFVHQSVLDAVQLQALIKDVSGVLDR